jgi:multiple sugar transport system ATP-binding protein
MGRVVLDAVRKVYRGNVVALADLSLEVEDGELLVLVGPSGCGKSTTQRLIAGLEEVTSGDIWIAGRRVTDLAAKDRDVAMVFQSAATFPYLSVADNIGFGLKLRGRPRAEIRTRVGEVAGVLGLGDLLDRRPAELSGGQRQRVAIGRAMLREPQAFLMDEPLSSLDARLRRQMRGELARLQRRLGTTTLYVTHDQEEAMTLGDRVAILNHGVLEQLGTPDDLYRHPASLVVATFIGSPPMNVIEATVSDGVLSFGQVQLAVAAIPAVEKPAGKTVMVGIRPSDLYDASTLRSTAAHAIIDTAVDARENLGSEVDVVFTLDERAATGQAPAATWDSHPNGRFTARLDGGCRLGPGDPLRLAFQPECLYLFDAKTGRALVRG